MFKPALLFQDGMVLQRGTPVPVWGLADPGAEVEVTIQGCAARTRAAAEAAGSSRSARCPSPLAGR